MKNATTNDQSGLQLVANRLNVVSRAVSGGEYVQLDNIRFAVPPYALTFSLIIQPVTSTFTYTQSTTGVTGTTVIARSDSAQTCTLGAWRYVSSVVTPLIDIGASTTTILSDVTATNYPKVYRITLQYAINATYNPICVERLYPSAS